MMPATLLLIDVQAGLDDPALGQRNKSEAEYNIARLLENWRRRNWPIVHVQHDSTEPQSKLRPGSPGNFIKQEAKPLEDEIIFGKSVNSAFIGTGLEQYLKEHSVEKLVVVGLTTDHCVSTSVRMAENLGFYVTLVADATATFERFGYNGVHYSAEDIHQVNLLSLQNEFCRIKTTAELPGN
ncbi:MAG: nicotinamidase-related amidase [Gammaproteobacteria bacterium]|jgi:nicotinamidase-related amidase